MTYFALNSGQIELYSHLPVMKQLCDALRDWGFNICGVYLVAVGCHSNGYSAIC